MSALFACGGGCGIAECVEDDQVWNGCGNACGARATDDGDVRVRIIGGTLPVASAVVADRPPRPVSPQKAMSHEVARLYFLLSPDHDVGIGVRSGPSLDAERTGGGVFPGDVVVGSHVQVVGGVPFLHLADDSGWVFCEHPETGKKLLQPITEEEAMLIIAALDSDETNADAAGFDEVDEGDSDR